MGGEEEKEERERERGKGIKIMVTSGAIKWGERNFRTKQFGE